MRTVKYSIQRFIPVLTCIVVLIVVLGCYYNETLFQKAFFIMDHSLQNYPFREYVSQQLHLGVFPLWCPYIGAGFPIFAEGQSGIVFPVNFIVSMFFSGWKSYSIQLLITYIIGAMGMVFYLRSLKLRVVPILMGSIVWCLNGYMMTHNMFINFFQSTMLIPATLYCIERFRRVPTVRNLVLILIMVVFIILAGHPQAAFIALIVIVPYFWIRGMPVLTSIKQKVGIFLVLVLFPLLASMVQVLPTLELVSESQRGENWSYDRMTEMSNPPHNLVSLLIPYYYGNPAINTYWGGNHGYFWEFAFYMGMAPLFMTCFSTRTKYPEPRIVKFFWFLLFTTILLSLGKYSIVYRLATLLPGYPFRIPARFLVLFVLSGSVLTAAGTQYLAHSTSFSVKPNVLKRVSFLGVIIGAIYLIIVIVNKNYYLGRNISKAGMDFDYVRYYTVLKPFWVNQLSYSMVMTGIFLALMLLFSRLYSRNSFMVAFKVLVLTLTIMDLYNVTHQYHHGINPELYTKKSPFLDVVKNEPGFVRLHSEIIENQSNARWHKGWKLSAKGYKLLYDGFWMYCGIPQKVPVIIISGWSPYHSRKMVEIMKSAPSQTLKLLGTRFVVLTFSSRVPGFKKIAKYGNLVFYRNKDNSPVLVIPRILVKVSPGNELSIISKPSYHPSVIAVTSDSKVESYRYDIQPGKITAISWNDQDIDIKVDMNKNAMLFVSNKFHEGWKVYVDSTQGKVVPLNYMFCGVPVPKGNHQLKLVFEPRSFKIGFFLSGISLSILVFVLSCSWNKVLPSSTSSPGMNTSKEMSGIRKLSFYKWIIIIFTTVLLVSIILNGKLWKDSLEYMKLDSIAKMKVDIKNL